VAIKVTVDVPVDELRGFHPRVANGPADAATWRLTASRPWTGDRWKWPWFEQARSDFRRANLTKLTHNFLWFLPKPGDGDYFDDAEFAVICHNVGLLARLARQIGFAGLLFNPEGAGEFGQAFDYRSQKHAAATSFDEYEVKVRQRGGEVMRAMAREYPDMVLLNLFMFSYGAEAMRLDDPAEVLADHSYGLLPAFCNGLLDEVPPSMTIVDGNENAYYYYGPLDFHRGYHVMRHQALSLVAPENRRKYQAQVQAGHAMFMDRFFAQKGQPIEECLKHFRDHLGWAMTTSDEYVWTWNEQVLWMPESSYNMPPGVTEALNEARARERAPRPAPPKPAPVVTGPVHYWPMDGDGRDVARSGLEPLTLTPGATVADGVVGQAASGNPAAGGREQFAAALPGPIDNDLGLTDKEALTLTMWVRCPRGQTPEKMSTILMRSGNGKGPGIVVSRGAREGPDELALYTSQRWDDGTEQACGNSARLRTPLPAATWVFVTMRQWLSPIDLPGERSSYMTMDVTLTPIDEGKLAERYARAAVPAGCTLSPRRRFLGMATDAVKAAGIGFGQSSLGAMQVDEAAIWDRCLREEELEALFQLGKNGKPLTPWQARPAP
jgi:hypothetical protein